MIPGAEARHEARAGNVVRLKPDGTGKHRKRRGKIVAHTVLFHHHSIGLAHDVPVPHALIRSSHGAICRFRGLIARHIGGPVHQIGENGAGFLIGAHIVVEDFGKDFIDKGIQRLPSRADLVQLRRVQQRLFGCGRHRIFRIRQLEIYSRVFRCFLRLHNGGCKSRHPDGNNQRKTQKNG